MIWHSYKIYTRPLSVRAQYSRLCPISGSFRYNGSLVTWTVVYLPYAIEIDSSVLVCSLVAGETCPQIWSQATAAVLSFVYTAVTWQWVYVPQHVEKSPSLLPVQSQINPDHTLHLVSFTLTYVISGHGPRRNTPCFNSTCIVARVSVAAGTCLPAVL
jgi:hypothetical protein